MALYSCSGKSEHTLTSGRQLDANGETSLETIYKITRRPMRERPSI